MKKLVLAAATVAAFVAFSAQAQTVYNTSLQNVSAPAGTTGGTTTDATGTRTTINGPAGGGSRASGTTTTGQWFQANVGAGGTTGITTDYARNGTGSAYFATTNDGSKADLQYYFTGGPVALSSLTSISYDFLRDGSSTVGAGFSPVMRLDILKNGTFAGSLVFENIYQTQQNAPTDAWTTLTGNLNSGTFWATNAALGPTFANANGGQKTLAQWIADNSTQGAVLTTYGMSIGVGSGWGNASLKGAIDNVAVNFTGGPSVNSNFEVSAAAVPEPASWAMMLVGMGTIGFAMRRRRRDPIAA